MDLETRERVPIESPQCVLGRQGDVRADLFQFETISRRHLAVSYEDGVWTARHIGLNAPQLASGGDVAVMALDFAYPLHDGDVLDFGERKFLVEMVQNTPPAEETAADDVQGEADGSQDDGLVEGWFITCPKCGSVFQVEGEGVRMGECPRCVDAMDKRAIRRFSSQFAKRDPRTVVDVR